MRLEAARLTLFAALALAGCATTHPTATATGPARLAVHIDTVDPAMFQRFVDARLKWVAYLQAHHESDLRGSYAQIGEHTFFSFYGFRKLADVTAHGVEAERRSKDVPKSVGDEYDQQCDGALVFPHTSEMWTERPELEFGSPSPTALADAAVGQAVFESLAPVKDQQYWDTWPLIQKALEQVKYPLTRVTYLANIGSGRMMSFWLAPSEAVLKAAPPLAQALAVAVGEARANELLKAWQGSVVATETQPFIVRHDMASPP